MSQDTAQPLPLEELRKLAEKATKGTWEWADEDGSLPMLMSDDSHDAILGCFVCKACLERHDKCLAPNQHDAAYIAAANPAAILALLDRLKAAEAEIAHQRTTMLAAKQEIDEHWKAHCDADGYGPVNLMRRLEVKAVCYPGHCETQRILSEALAASEKRAEDCMYTLAKFHRWNCEPCKISIALNGGYWKECAIGNMLVAWSPSPTVSEASEAGQEGAG